MSRLSIYENSWTSLIFENRNQEYGAYQLRQESVKNSYAALFMGLLLVSSMVAVPSVVNYFKAAEPDVIDLPTKPFDKIIKVDNFVEPKTNKPAAKLPQTNTEPATTVNKKQLINPIITTAAAATPLIATNAENNKTSEIPTIGTGTSGVVTPNTGNGTAATASTGTDYGTTIVNTAMLDKRPEFPGGMENFYKYIGRNFEKPELDSESIFKIYLSFVIEKDGSMTDITVLRDPGYGLGNEAIRVLKSLKTKWTPGIIDAKPVRAAYTLPISIEMN